MNERYRTILCLPLRGWCLCILVLIENFKMNYFHDAKAYIYAHIKCEPCTKRATRTLSHTHTHLHSPHLHGSRLHIHSFSNMTFMHRMLTMWCTNALSGENVGSSFRMCCVCIQQQLHTHSLLTRIHLSHSLTGLKEAPNASDFMYI